MIQQIVTTNRSERVIKGATIDELASGPVARCAGAADVIHCVRFAREYDVLVSERGGGHHYGVTSLIEWLCAAPSV